MEVLADVLWWANVLVLALLFRRVGGIFAVTQAVLVLFLGVLTLVAESAMSLLIIAVLLLWVLLFITWLCLQPGEKGMGAKSRYERCESVVKGLYVPFSLVLIFGGVVFSIAQ